MEAGRAMPSQASSPAPPASPVTFTHTSTNHTPARHIPIIPTSPIRVPTTPARHIPIIPTSPIRVPTTPASAKHITTSPTVPHCSGNPKYISPTNPAAPKQVAHSAPLPTTPKHIHTESVTPTNPATPTRAPSNPKQANAGASPKGQAPWTPRQKPVDRNTENATPEQNNVSRVLVTGFPPYTTSNDLSRTFVKYGTVRIEKMNARGSYAVLKYTTVEEAKEALQASKKVNIYGEILYVKQFSGREPKPVQPKRDFTLSKQKGMIIDPKDIDLSGDFHDQVDKILASVRLTQEEATAISTLYADVERVLQAQWPGCVVMPFGSITTGLGIKTSDADCFVHVPASQRHGVGGATLVNRAKRVLQNYPQIFAEILAIPRANTPIVKFFHVPTGTNCDLSFKTPLGSQNSRLISFLLHADPRLLPLAVVIKYWAKVHGLSGTGRLTNYALTMLIIFYLQQPPMCILPSVESLQRDPRHEEIVDYWNTGFSSQREQLPPCLNTSTIAELLGGFFEFYAQFNYTEMVICPYLGYAIKKDLFFDLNLLPVEYRRYICNVSNGLVPAIRANTTMVVQDPFEQSHNVASAISSKLAAEILAYLKLAAETYENDKLNGCQNLLKTILIQKPKIVRSRAHPEYRVNLFPKIVTNIAGSHWTDVIRNTVKTIFETMLKIKLHKMDERLTQFSKKKERYMGLVSKAIWKRKQFTILYGMMNNLDFKQKQTKITEEINRVEKNIFNLQFHLTLIFGSEPKNSLVLIKLTNGDPDAFKEFGRFFVSILYTWMAKLLDPGQKAAAEDSASKMAETIKMLDDQMDINDDLDSDDDDEANSSADTTAESESDKGDVPDDEKERDDDNSDNTQACAGFTAAPDTH